MGKKKGNLKTFNRDNRPDFSEYLSHFTKDEDFCNEDQGEVVAYFKNMTARDRLFSILKTKTLKTSKMPWTQTQGLCFTECPWSSLLVHTKQYSSYGIGFTKEFIYKNGGAPVFYMRKKNLNILEKTIKDKKVLEKLLSFVTPYSPIFETRTMRKQIKLVDYTHEREWRMTNDLHFEYKDVAFLVVGKHEDFDSLPKSFQDNYDRNKIIVMDNYRLVEELWPVHIK